MTPAETRQAYMEAMDDAGESISIRRFTGTGVTRTYVDTNARARVIDYQERELVGTIQQGDRKIIMLVDDLIAGGFAVPVTANDKVVLRGKMISIVSVDDSTRRVQGELIAYEIQARG
jgi:hypothetical protein